MNYKNDIEKLNSIKLAATNLKNNLKDNKDVQKLINDLLEIKKLSKDIIK